MRGPSFSKTTGQAPKSIMPSNCTEGKDLIPGFDLVVDQFMDGSLATLEMYEQDATGRPRQLTNVSRRDAGASQTIRGR